MSLEISRIRIDGGTQSRAAISEATVAEYAEAMADADTVFPPVIVYFDGKDYWLADGFHRVAAWSRLGRAEIPAEIRQGDRRRAILHSVAANSTHGLRRTNDDKRRAVMTLLDDAEWSQWSNREIARRCGVSESFVRTMRDPICAQNADRPVRTVERNGTVYQQNTANIGASSKPDQKSEPAQAFEGNAENIEVASEGNRPAQSDREDKTAVEPNDPDANLRRELSKLTHAALVDDLIAARHARAEDRAKIAALEAELESMKSQWAAAAEGSNIGRALGHAERQKEIAEGRMKEFQATAVRLDRRVKALEAENKKLRAEIENTEIKL